MSERPGAPGPHPLGDAFIKSHEGLICRCGSFEVHMAAWKACIKEMGDDNDRRVKELKAIGAWNE